MLLTSKGGGRHLFFRRKTILVYINDLPGVVGSVCKLFADECKLYRNIESKADMMELQEDIERVCKWNGDWILGLNIKKFVI